MNEPGGLRPPVVTYSEPIELRLRDESSLFLGPLATLGRLLGLLLRRLALLCHGFLLGLVEVLRLVLPVWIQRSLQRAAGAELHRC
jgi:hypothetical protein